LGWGCHTRAVFHDRARIWVEGGRGGDGCVSFRREAHVPRGGPDGGDGGRGGDVVLVCDSSRRDLAELRIAGHFKAGRGEHGRGKNQHGARGADREILVPPGTTAEHADGTAYDLTEAGQRAVVAAGGEGGHGNKRFATSTRQAPRFAERGLPGEEGWVELRLRLLADAGIVGLPNAGKSSLLSALTRARPKVAEYPFTTIDPVLGTIDDGEGQLVLADIPGLIEGAADGAGLGHEFLAHVERCRALVHLVAVDPLAPDGLVPAYETVRAELAAHGGGLDRLPELVVLSKADLAPPEALDELVGELRQRTGGPVLAISAVTGAGLADLVQAVTRRLAEVTEAERPAAPRVVPPHLRDAQGEVEEGVIVL
jgi:GTP-binding protein